MANLFQNKPDNKKVEVSVGTFYVKPLPMSMIGWATKLSDPDIDPTTQMIAFANILKAVAVDENGNELEDVAAMEPKDLAAMFPMEDLMSFVQIILPAPDADKLGNAG